MDIVDNLKDIKTINVNFVDKNVDIVEINISALFMLNLSTKKTVHIWTALKMFWPKIHNLNKSMRNLN